MSSSPPPSSPPLLLQEEEEKKECLWCFRELLFLDPQDQRYMINRSILEQISLVCRDEWFIEAELQMDPTLEHKIKCLTMQEYLLWYGRKDANCNENLFGWCARMGFPNIVQFLFRYGFKNVDFESDALKSAVCNNHFDVIQVLLPDWVVMHKHIDDTQLIEYCVYHDNLKMLDFLVEKGVRLDVYKNIKVLMCRAAFHGRLEIMEYAVKKDIMLCEQQQQQHIQSRLLEKFGKETEEITSNMYKLASSQSRILVTDNYYECALVTAAQRGKFAIISFLVEFVKTHFETHVVCGQTFLEKIPDTDMYKFETYPFVCIKTFLTRAYCSAAFYGHTEIVQYLVENGAVVNTNDSETLRVSAGRGHLETVCYLVEKCNMGLWNLKYIVCPKHINLYIYYRAFCGDDSAADLCLHTRWFTISVVQKWNALRKLWLEWNAVECVATTLFESISHQEQESSDVFEEHPILDRMGASPCDAEYPTSARIGASRSDAEPIDAVTVLNQIVRRQIEVHLLENATTVWYYEIDAQFVPVTFPNMNELKIPSPFGDAKQTYDGNTITCHSIGEWAIAMKRHYLF